jgi:hypothetical protein
VTELINLICCTSIFDLFDFQNASATYNLTEPREAAVAQPFRLDRQAGVHPFTQLAAEPFFGVPKANPATVLLAAMGARAADGSPLVSDLALEHPGEAILLHQVLVPLVESLLPVETIKKGGAEAAASATLTQEIERLRETVRRHEEAIVRLENR